MLFKLTMFILQAESTFQTCLRSEGPWLGEKINSLQSVAKNRGSHMLSPWSPQDRATAWYHSTSHLRQGGKNVLQSAQNPLRDPVSPLLVFPVSQTELQGFESRRVLSPRRVIREGEEVSRAVRNLCPHTGSASPARPGGTLGFWQTWRVSYFHMDELYSTTSSVYQEPKSVDIENKVFSFQLFQSPVFKGDLFFMAGATDSCLPLHGGLPWSSSGISETVPGISGVWVGIGAFWLNIFNLREPLYSRKVFSVASGQQIQSQRQMVLHFGVRAQRIALFVARIPPKMAVESWGLCLSTLQRVYAGAA